LRRKQHYPSHIAMVYRSRIIQQLRAKFSRI
jgi:hypothetical protein